jgi:hypothetical protein
LGWQVQPRRPGEVIAGTETDEFIQRRIAKIACLLEWAWFALEKRPGPFKEVYPYYISGFADIIKSS